MKKSISAYILILLISTTLVILIKIKANNDYQAALASYRQHSHEQATETKIKLEYFLREIQQNLRTISFLPSVINIDRHGANLDKNAHESIQQIYNNLKNNIAVSEVYIVPESLEPEEIDPETKQPQAPILMFDKLIMSAEDRKTEADNGIAQEEIYEYRVLKEQIKWFKTNYPTLDSVDKLNLPFISTPEVITCDNSQFIDNKIDANRSGIVLSVPFYGADKKLKGTLTAVMLTNNIRNIIANPNYALTNAFYNYFVMQKDGQASQSRKFILTGNPDPNLLFSEVLSLNINNLQSPWKLWVGYPNNLFLNSSTVTSIEMFEFISYSAVGILFICSFIMLTFLLKKNKLAKLNSEILERKVIDRTLEIETLAEKQKHQQLELEKQKQTILQKMANNLDELVKGFLYQIINATTQIQLNSKNTINIATNTIQCTEIVANSSSSNEATSLQISEAVKQLTTSIEEINLQTSGSEKVANLASNKVESAKKAIDLLCTRSEEVNKIINIITSIADKINLLALNATIESARAGEAGKGFAVVASEIKNLSNQVAKASDEINHQMDAIKFATKESVVAVNEILDVIKQISSNTTIISQSVRQQSELTDGIVKNINFTTNVSKEISSHIILVQEESKKTKNSATEAIELTNNLSNHSNILKEKINEFIAIIKADT